VNADCPPTLAVALGTRNRLARLQDCLQSLVGKIGVAHEIVVIDAGSTDGTLEYLRNLPGICLVIDGELFGQAHSLNQVFRTVTAKYACWLSDDNVVMNGMLDLAVSILERRPDIGMVALKIKDVLGRSATKQYMGAFKRTGVLNCNHGIIRTDVLRQVGYLDERNHGYGFDPDLTMKVLLAGHKVAHTKAVAIHHYNDHFAAPGAVGHDERAARLAAVRALYEETYRQWLAPLSPWQRALLGAVRRFVIYPTYGAARRAGRPLEQRLGYTERDWTNMLHGRYISKLDLWRNRRNPYCLVQSIPPGLLRARNKVAG